MAFLDGWQFCPRCGTEGEHRGDQFACPACGHVVWSNSIPGVEAVIERDGRVLLARRANEPGKGLWDLPGGFPDEQEGPLEALAREVREETGLALEGIALLGIWLEPDYEGRSVFSVTYRATAAPGEAVAADDVAELQWVAADELPPDAEFAFVHTPEALRLWRAGHEQA
ncbi:MAG TPA: NUDIX domain-containing protein [Gaiella sp.]|nr:NUDIX domain-containing protein [Gaiella sp.]